MLNSSELHLKLVAGQFDLLEIFCSCKFLWKRIC